MIEIYYRAGCPYCDKVLRAAASMGLKEGEHFTTVNAAPGTPGLQRVKSLGGDTMVPFLVDGSHWMYESDDIINYLRRKFS